MRAKATTQQNTTQGIRLVFFWASFFQTLFFTLDISANSNSTHSIFGERLAYSYSYKMRTLSSEPLNALSNQKFIFAGGHRLNPPTGPDQPEQYMSEEVQTTTGSFPSDPGADTNQPEQDMSEEVQTTTGSFSSDPEADTNQPEQYMSEGVQTRSLGEEGTPEPANDESQPDLAKKDEEAKLQLVHLRFNEGGADYKSKNYRRAFNRFLEIATKHDFPQAQFNLAVMLKLGQGTLQDYGQAYKWCALAGLTGLRKAEKYQERLKDLLTEKRHEELHQEVAKLLEQNIYSGSKKHILQLSRWLTREPFDDKKSLDLALIWALVGSALDLDEATKIRETLAEDLEIDELEKIQTKAREIFTDPKFQKLYGAL